MEGLLGLEPDAQPRRQQPRKQRKGGWDPDDPVGEERGRRFKMRNGREILEERAFLVGVEVRTTGGRAEPPRPQGDPRHRSSSSRGELGSRAGSPLALQGDAGAGSPLDSAPVLLPSYAAQPREPSRASPQAQGGRGAEAGALFPVEESLDELARLCETAGLRVVGRTSQRLEAPNPRTYMGSGKVQEVRAAVAALDAETVVFDDELSPGQLRNLEKELGGGVRVCDRTALILDIFSQRANTKEATLQVELAQTAYQLPRLTRMWTHLERQAGGLVKGMGEKQIEVDKRILRDRMGALKESLRVVQGHRQQYRKQRAQVPIPVLSLVGYTNAGKSTLMNRLSGASVLAEDQLFATLDPTTRRIQLPNGKECLLTDTVGFIQKLPTQLVAAFRATLEEIADASVLLLVVDGSDPMAPQQVAAVEQVLQELGAADIPMIKVLNKADCLPQESLLSLQAAPGSAPLSLSSAPLSLSLSQAQAGLSSTASSSQGTPPLIHSPRASQAEAEGAFWGGPQGGDPGGPSQALAYPSAEEGVGSLPGAWAAGDWVPVSALTGLGIQHLLQRLQSLVNESMVRVEAVIPYAEGQLLSLVFRLGAVTAQEHCNDGTRIVAHVPLRIAQVLLPYRKR